MSSLLANTSIVYIDFLRLFGISNLMAAPLCYTCHGRSGQYTVDSTHIDKMLDTEEKRYRLYKEFYLASLRTDYIT